RGPRRAPSPARVLGVPTRATTSVTGETTHARVPSACAADSARHRRADRPRGRSGPRCRGRRSRPSRARPRARHPARRGVRGPARHRRRHPVTLDIAVVDVALGLLGEASTTPDSSPAEAAPAPAAPEPPGGTVDVDVPVTIDVDVTDIAVGLLGEASTSAPAQPPAEPSDLAEPAEPAEPAEAAEPAEPAGGGADAGVPIELAVDISHLAVGVLGDASTSGESEPEAGTPQPQAAEAGTVGTVGAAGAAGGVTIGVPVRVPVSVTCNSLAVLGDAAAGCDA